MVGLEHAGGDAVRVACRPQDGAETTVLVTIDDALKKKCPRAALGCVTARVETRKTPPELTEEMHKRVQEILKLPYARGVLEAPQILSTRAAYKALGKDPSRYRGSAEALLRRVIAGKGLPEINAVVDVINLISVESRLPVGLYDIDHVSGDVVFRVGRAGESYPGIGKYDLNLEGLPVFCDTTGPHGSPTSDSERTMVTSETKLVLAVIVSFNGSELLDRWTKRMIELLQLHASGQAFQASIVT
jgi:DNA/RNA-binding domain of Phe-tRNA-synthetase-like protein